MTGIEKITHAEIARRMIEVATYLLWGEWMAYVDMAEAIGKPTYYRQVANVNATLKGWPDSPGIAIPLHMADGTADWARSEHTYPNAEQIHRLIVNFEAKMGLPSDRPWPQEQRVRGWVMRQRMQDVA